MIIYLIARSVYCIYSVLLCVLLYIFNSESAKVLLRIDRENERSVACYVFSLKKKRKNKRLRNATLIFIEN